MSIYHFIHHFIIFNIYFIIFGNYNYPKIENNTEKNIGIIEIIYTDKNDKILIKKGIFEGIKQFISCLGNPGSGKSSFSSNYYKELYYVKNDYFEISKQSLSFTKGIWMISDEERKKNTRLYIKRYIRC